jgi:glycosyltransferase involved in cell wall biosynthesis
MAGVPPEALSIVIPAHRIAALLPECLASIRAHGGARCPAILVDDGSGDLPSPIRAKLAGIFGGRLTWLHQPHAGPGAARNAGLALVETPWVTFVDGDDVLDGEGLPPLLRAAEPGVDIVFSNKMVSWQLPPRIETLRDFTDQACVPIRDVPCESRLSCHGKLFRTGFLRAHGIRFPEGMLWEDIVFSHQTYRHAGRVSAVSAVTYLWRKRPPGVGSITQRPLDPAAIRDRFRQVEMSVAISETPEWRANFGASFGFAALLRRRLSPVFRAIRAPSAAGQAEAALALIRDLCEPHAAVLAREPEAGRRIFERVRALDLAGIRALQD